MSDRTMATDALATLGTAPLDDTARRDAIHLAVIPATAGEMLCPGEHITIAAGVARSAHRDDALGIVDPFLARTLQLGERFWLVLYPRTITSLRHAWSHPAFPDEPMVRSSDDERAIGQVAPDKEASERWLREFCDRSDCPSYERVMDAIEDGNVDQYSLHVNGDASGEIPEEFWLHVEVVLGRKVPHRPAYFSCSC